MIITMLPSCSSMAISRDVVIGRDIVVRTWPSGNIMVVSNRKKTGLWLVASIPTVGIRRYCTNNLATSHCHHAPTGGASSWHRDRSRLTRPPPHRIDHWAASAWKRSRLGTMCGRGGNEEGRKGTGGGNSSTVQIVAAIDHGGRHLPTAAMRSHSNQQSIQYIMIITIFMAYFVTTNQQIFAPDRSQMWWSYRWCRAPTAIITAHIHCICPPWGFLYSFRHVTHLREHRNWNNIGIN